MKERKLGLIGKKVGMTRIFKDDGTAIGVTVVEVGPCLVLGKRTDDIHGYNALILGFGSKPVRKVNKPEAGTLKAVGGAENARRFVQELRVTAETLARFDVGQEIKLADLDLSEGAYVDVTGESKGKGFQGVMKRHNFGGFRASHGTHEVFRHGGSIGCRKWPGRVFKGRKMAGQMGSERVTTQNIRIVSVRSDDNVILLCGSVPGCKTGIITVRPALKHNQ